MDSSFSFSFLMRNFSCIINKNQDIPYRIHEKIIDAFLCIDKMMYTIHEKKKKKKKCSPNYIGFNLKYVLNKLLVFKVNLSYTFGP